MATGKGAKSTPPLPNVTTERFNFDVVVRDAGLTRKQLKKQLTINTQAETLREDTKWQVAQALQQGVGWSPDNVGLVPTNPDGSGVIYNLPPHKTSLPVVPNVVFNEAGKPATSGSITSISPMGGVGRGEYGTTYQSSVSDSARRGRMWVYAGVAYAEDTLYGTNDWKWGFQFMWNPTDININVHRNQDMMPSTADIFKTISGNFQGQESVQFTVYLDRTNDFAALRGRTVTDYSAHYPSAPAGLDVPTAVAELLKRGTDHDIQYLFKMVNGEGGDYTTGVDSAGNQIKQSKTKWTNALGRITADTAYLAPVQIAVMFGPYAEDSLSYVGWIESVNIRHTAFTEDMIPIRSQLDFNVIAFTTHPIG